MEKEEIWKPVKGYRGFYEVSNKGRIKRVAGGLARNERIMKPDAHGTREHIYLSNGYNKKKFLILDIVKEAFPDTKMKRKIKPVTKVKTVEVIHYPVTIIERTDELLGLAEAEEIIQPVKPRKLIIGCHKKDTKGKWFNP